jgi:hypothetical protein
MKTWAGQDLQATVFASGKNSQVVVGGTIARRGGLAGGQQIAWGEKSALSQKFLAEIESILPTIPESPFSHLPPPPTVSPPFVASSSQVSRLDELAKAAELRDRGVLTEEEFLSEKARILKQ